MVKERRSKKIKENNFFYFYIKHYYKNKDERNY